MMEQTKPTYDPSKQYKWEVDQPFTLSGTEFGFCYNTLIRKKTELLSQLQMLDILEYKLKLAVEEGVAAELPQEAEQTPKKLGKKTK